MLAGRWLRAAAAAILACALVPLGEAVSTDAVSASVRGTAKVRSKAKAKIKRHKARLGSKALFAAAPSDSLLSSCMAAIHRGAQASAGGDFAGACRQEFADAPAMDCEEFAGRAEEAHEQGYLTDGRLLCGRLVQEHSDRSGQPLADYYAGGNGASTTAATASSEGGIGAAFAKIIPAIASGATSSPAAAASASLTGTGPAGPSVNNRIWAEMAALLHGTG